MKKILLFIFSISMPLAAMEEHNELRKSAPEEYNEHCQAALLTLQDASSPDSALEQYKIYYPAIPNIWTILKEMVSDLPEDPTKMNFEQAKKVHRVQIVSQWIKAYIYIGNLLLSEYKAAHQKHTLKEKILRRKTYFP